MTKTGTQTYHPDEETNRQISFLLDNAYFDDLTTVARERVGPFAVTLSLTLTDYEESSLFPNQKLYPTNMVFQLVHVDCPDKYAALGIISLSKTYGQAVLVRTEAQKGESRPLTPDMVDYMLDVFRTRLRCESVSFVDDIDWDAHPKTYRQ